MDHPVVPYQVDALALLAGLARALLAAVHGERRGAVALAHARAAPPLHRARHVALAPVLPLRQASVD